MGIPQHTSTDKPSSTSTAQPQNDGVPTEALPSSTGDAPVDQQQRAETLPPAAIELATKLFDAARTGDTNTLQTYIRAGIPPNMTNHKGDTLLMLAAYHGHAQTVSLLLSLGADPDVLNDRGQSPIAGAVFKAHDDVVKVLYEGVDMGAGDGRRSKKADLYHGQPNAVDSARMFKQEGYLNMFGVEMGQVPGQIPNGAPTS